jgi:hypothetical protein
MNMDQFSSHPFYRKHTIDSLMSSLWDFYTRKFVVLFITSFIMSLGVQYLSSFFNFSGIEITNPTAILEKLREFIWPMVFISLISLVFTVILNYYIIYSPVDEKVNIFVSAYKSMKYIIPYLIILILLAFMGSFALILGFFVLVIGMFFAAIYIATLYLFVLPVLMVEGNNIGNAISRTFILTHRKFWSNIGWVTVIVLIILVFSFIFSSLILIPFSGSFFKVLSNPEEVSNMLNFTSNPVYIILSALVNSLVFPVLPLLAAILYFNGKAREDDVSAVFTQGDGPEKIKVEDLYSKSLPEEGRENTEKS